jgi:hypothetical protein
MPDDPAPRKTFSQFLINSGIAKFRIVGLCMEYFGMAVVVAFAVGGSSVSAYALFRPLPYYGIFGAASSSVGTAQSSSQTVTLEGRVETPDGTPLRSGFTLAILPESAEHGPYQNESGAFSVTIEQRNKYNVAVYSDDMRYFKIYQGIPVRKEGDRHVLNSALILPTDLGIIEGTVTDADGKPFPGYVHRLGADQWKGREGQ